jgi:hypothetical protein
MIIVHRVASIDAENACNPRPLFLVFTSRGKKC